MIRSSLWALAFGRAFLLACAALPAVAATTASTEAVHTLRVQRGDTLIAIARRFLAEPQRWPELARLNGLPDANRLAVGAPLQVPHSWLRFEAVPAEVLKVSGEVHSGGVPVREGQRLPEGSTLVTAADGQAFVRLVDGTFLRLRNNSVVQLQRSRRLPDVDVVRSGARLERGRVDVETPKAGAPAGSHTGDGKPGFQITTPQGVLAVRGTEYRVGTGADAITRSEVLTGLVDVGTVPVGAGLGTTVDASGSVAPPRPLLPAPATNALPSLQERPLVQFLLPELPGAVAWRAALWDAARAQEPSLMQLEVRGNTLRIADLPDGPYLLRLRGVDAAGLEGFDASHPFLLKARPEPPILLQPQPGASVVGAAQLLWAEQAQAQSYRVQVAADAAFSQALQEFNALPETRLVVPGLTPQRWYWRVRSVRVQSPGAAAPDLGPWGEPSSFVQRPGAPGVQPPSLQPGDEVVPLSWGGQPGQSFELQVALDAAFSQMVFSQRLSTPSVVLRLPGSGRYHLRLRAIEADGFVGPWGAPQQFELLPCVLDGMGRCAQAASSAALR